MQKIGKLDTSSYEKMSNSVQLIQDDNDSISIYRITIERIYIDRISELSGRCVLWPAVPVNPNCSQCT